MTQPLPLEDFDAPFDEIESGSTKKTLSPEELGVLFEKIESEPTGKLSELAKIAGLSLAEDYIGADLSHENLSEDNLSGINLTDANLSGADLSRSDLRNANLSGVNFSNANLSGTDLRGANLSGANLRGANLSGASLSEANFRGADLNGTNLDEKAKGQTDDDWKLNEYREELNKAVHSQYPIESGYRWSDSSPDSLILADLPAGDYILDVRSNIEADYRLGLNTSTVDLLTGLPIDSGYFIVDETGEVKFDFEIDGGRHRSEVAIFSLRGMESLEVGSDEWIREAARRALSNSEEGHIVISDAREGAKSNPPFLADDPQNAGPYLGEKTFEMRPGDAVGVMVVPDATVEKVLTKPVLGRKVRPFFSMAAANPDGEVQISQLERGDDYFLTVEDRPVRESDRDYNDLVVRVEGMTPVGLVPVEVVIGEGEDWIDRSKQVERLMVKEEKIDRGNVDERSGKFGIGHMSGGEIQSGAIVAGVIKNYPSIPPFVCLDHQLPSTSDFQGRGEEIEEVQGWLRKDCNRFVGIVSPGGYGKSTLAARIYQESSAFEQKLWITLNQSYSFNSFSNGLLNKLGKKVHISCSDDSLKNQIINYFSDSDSSFLLVIDNLDFLLDNDRRFEDLGYERFFQQWLTNENNNNTIIFTSRKKPTTLEQFRLECEFLDLKGLSAELGIQLLRKRKITGTPQNLQRFVQIADGHPLLLNLAASWLHDRPTETPDVKYILRENDLDWFGRLVGLHRGISEATVGQVLAASLEGLTARLREVWLNLSVYKYRSIDLEAAQSVTTETITERDLRELARRSLLEEEKSQGQWKYRFLNLVNKFAQQQAGDRKEAKQKAIEYCRSVAMPSGWEENDAKIAAIYRVILRPPNWETQEDIAEYLEIFHYHYELCQYDVAFSFLWNTGCDTFLELRGDNSIRVDLYTILREKWCKRLFSGNFQLHDLNNEERDIFYVEQKWFAEMLNCLGTAHRYLGHYSLAIELHKEALNQFFQLDNSDREKAKTLNYLGKVYWVRGKYQQAASCFEQAREIFHRINDAFSESLSLQDLIDTDSARGLHHKNIERYQRLLTLTRQFYPLSVEANTLNQLGITYYKIGKYKYATCVHRKALKIFQELHHQQGKTESWHRLGDAYEALGRHQDAIDAHEQALRMSGDRLEQANARCRLGWDLQSSGDSEAAIEKFNWALAIFRELGNRSGEAMALNGLGAANSNLGNDWLPESYYTDALDIHRQLHDLDGQAVVLNNLGVIYEQRGNNERLLTAPVEPERDRPGILNLSLPRLEQYRQAINFYEQSLEIRNGIPDRDLGQDARTRKNLGRVCNLLGQSYYNCRHYQEAARLYQQALSAFQGIQGNFRTNEIKEGKVTALLGLGNAYHFLGQYLDAIDLHQQTVEISRQLGDRPGEAEALLGLGNTCYALGRYDRPDDKNALSYYRQALTIFQELNAWQGIARVQLGLGQTSHSLGECQTAIEYLNEGDS